LHLPLAPPHHLPMTTARASGFADGSVLVTKYN